MVVLTRPLVPGVQQLHQRSRGPLRVNGICRLLVLGQLAQHASRNALDVLHRRVEELSGEISSNVKQPARSCQAPDVL